MAQAWKTVRVFICSTFQDMHAERDHLVRFVFPELRERCAKRQLHLVDVDLRWGVTEEEAEQKILEVCLDEIERCRPFFIGILGERYGWVPPKYEVPDEKHYDWVREFEPGHSITAMEIYHGVLRNPDMKMRAFFYFRDPAFLSVVPKEHRKVFLPESEESIEIEKLKRLKDDIRKHCPVFDYSCAFSGISEDGKVMLTGLEAFGQRVLEDLWSAIDLEYPVEEKPPDELAMERAYHEAFIEGRCQRFIGRRDLLEQMTAYADGENNVPLVITGAPGCGKSALLANFARAYATTSDVFVLPHFIGVSPGSTDIRRTLLRLCRELAQRFGIADEIPEDYEKLRGVFSKFMEQAASQGKVLLILDALNQLDESYYAHTLNWLPYTLPKNLRLIVSTLEGDCLEALHRCRPAPPEISMGPLAPEDRRQIIRQTLWDYRKRLDERPEKDQMGLLLGKVESDSPLYLIVACEELRVFGEFERVTERIASLPNDALMLFDQVLERLEHDHGKEMVKSALSLLACARHGLLETEMLELLRREGEEQLPRAIWARLYRSLQFYLRPPGEMGEGALDFFHGQLAKAVRQRYLASEDEKRTEHKHLAGYFRDKADPEKNQSWKSEDARPFLEMPFHITMGRLGAQLESTLSDFKFLDKKLVACGPRELLKDFEDASSFSGDWLANAEALRSIELALRLCANTLAQHPQQLPAQLIGHLIDQDAPMIQKLVLSAARNGGGGKPWLRPLKRCFPLGTGALMASARSSHLDMIIGFILTPDGRKMVSWDIDGLCAWSIEGLTRLRHRRAPGSGCTIQAVAPLPDSRRIVFAMNDMRNTIFVWDIETDEVHEFLQSQERVEAIAVVGNFLVTAGGKGALGVWDSVHRQWLGCLPTDRNQSPIHAIIATPDGNALIGVADDLICSWVLPGCDSRFVRHVPSLRVDHLCITADGRYLLTVGGITYGDQTVRVFDALTGNLWRTLEGHTDGVVDVAVEPNNGWVYSASRDKTVGIWDFSTGRLLRSVRNANVWALAVLPDGSLVTDHDHHEIQLWRRRSLRSQWEGDIAGPIDALAIDGSGTSLVAATNQEIPVRWSRGTRTEMPLEAAVRQLAMTDDGRMVLAALDSGKVVIWDTTEGRLIEELDGKGPPVAVLRVSEDGGIVVARTDGSIRVWHTANTLRPRVRKLVKWIRQVWSRREAIRPKCLLSGRVSGEPLAVSPDGRTAVCIGSDVYDDLGIYDVTSGRLIRRLRHSKRSRTIGAAAISPHGDRVAVASGSWRTEGGSIVLVEGLCKAPEDIGRLEDVTDHVVSLAFSNDGNLLVTCDTSGTLILWDIATGALIPHYGSSGFCICSISRKGNVIAAGDRNGFIHLLQIETGQSSKSTIVQYCESTAKAGMPLAPYGGSREPGESKENGCASDNISGMACDALTAVRSGNTNELIELLSACPDIVNRDISLGSTLLQYAVADGHYDVVRVLLAHGAKVNTTDNRDFTPLHGAAYHGHAHIAKLLLDAGASIDSLDDMGMAPIHVAAFEGRTDVVKLLLTQASVPVDQRDRRNRTSLHHAGSGCRTATADFLLSHGADVNAVADDGSTPLDWAWYRRNNQSIVSLLKKHGGKRRKVE